MTKGRTMKVNELYQLAAWYQKNVIPRKLTKSYEECTAVINTMLNQNANKNTIASRCKQMLEKLHSLLQDINTDELSSDDISALRQMGLENIFLKPAYQSLESLLNNGNDIDTISARIIDRYNKLKEADILFNQISDIIPRLMDVSGEKEAYNPEKVLTRITFHNEASINNVVDLSDWAESLSKIARGYSMMVGQTPEDFEVVSASKGSIIIDLLLNYEVVNMVGETVNHIAEFIEHLVEIKVGIETLKHLKPLDPDLYKKSVDTLQAELTTQQEQIAEEVANKLHDEYAIDKTNHEPKQAVKNSVKELKKLLDKGGDIEFLGNSEEISKNEQIEYVNQALLMLKERSKQKILEDKSEE